ncbi:MAG TPA: hypothetical protein ENN84_03510 [Candidatus Marinimicrobia bacterium]|nr:hypothetical protein [Candidatus Neomarinimicrobiota bacterium]
MQLSGFVDDETVVKLGEIAGAQYILTGRLNHSGGLIKIQEVYPKYSKGYIVCGRYAFGKDADLQEVAGQKIYGFAARIFSGGNLIQLDTNGVFPEVRPSDMAYSAGIGFGFDDFGYPYMADIDLAYFALSKKIWALNLELSGKMKIPLIPQYVRLYPLAGIGLIYYNQALTDLAIEKANIPSNYQDDDAYAIQLYGRGGAGIELNPIWKVGLSAELSYNQALSSGLNWKVLDTESDDSDAISVSENYLRYKDGDLSGIGLRVAAVYHF